MKKKVLLFMLTTLLLLTGCEEKEDKKMSTTNQNLTVLKEENGEILEGTLEGYHFIESEVETDRVKIQMENNTPDSARSAVSGDNPVI